MSARPKTRVSSAQERNFPAKYPALISILRLCITHHFHAACSFYSPSFISSHLQSSVAFPFPLETSSRDELNKIELKSIASTRSRSSKRRNQPRGIVPRFPLSILTRVPIFLDFFFPFDPVNVHLFTVTSNAHVHAITARYRFVSSCTISRAPQTPLSATCIHWVYRIVSLVPRALKLALRNNLAASKARAHSRAGRSLILCAFIYFDRVRRVYPGITSAICSPRASIPAGCLPARGLREK